MRDQHVDFTSCFRALSSTVRGDVDPARALFADPAAFDDWSVRHLARQSADGRAVAASMDRVNPIYIPRNQIVEQALTAASDDGDLQPLQRLLDVITRPFDERRGFESFAAPAPPSLSGYQTFCGT